MKVLLTGAGGFLGKSIARSLLEEGVADLRLHVRNQPPAGLIEALRAQAPAARVEPAAANLLARGRLQPLVEGIDCVIHAAAGMRGGAADMFANTVIGTRNLLEAVRDAGVKRFVLISSFSVYQTEPLPDGAWLDERVPIEPVGTAKGPYGYAKTRQEQMVTEFTREHGIECIVLRPGVIYGPGGGAMSPRVGLAAMGLFVSLGGGVTLPLTYVDNCADAVARAALKAAAGSAFNVVDDDLPSCNHYLARYRREVKPLRVLRLPYRVFLWSAGWLQRYHQRSKGQLPAVFTPYVVRSMYRPLRYGNQALKDIGWTPRVPTAEGLSRTFAALKAAARP